MNRDLDTVAEYIKEEKKRRKSSKYRLQHERIWEEVDRQVAMQPEAYLANEPREGWEPNIELGSIADASEIIADDVMRIAFPSDRDWYQPHVNLAEEAQIDPETGDQIIDVEMQKLRDNVYRSLLSQQHADFGLKHRVKLSVKEALHHGSFVATVEWRNQRQFYGASVKEIGAPVWVPHSMWNCYPDESPDVIGTNITYDGSMIIEHEFPISTVLQQKWMNLDKVKEKNTNKNPQIKLIYYYGDIYIKRSAGDGIFIPNQKVIVYEDWVLFTETNPTPSSPVLYAGYERDDVRDPYYSSPLIKRSPTHKLATHCANKYVEALDLRTKPPVGYDANEPAFRGGGPVLAPGEYIPLRAGGALKTIEVADPSWALQGLQLFKSEVEEGVGVDAVRKGATAAVEQTAYEVSKLDQKSEIRTIDFVATLEVQALKPYLYFQHDLNKRNLRTYGFYNTQLNTPDFVTADRSDINEWAKEVHFEVIGSKGVLGEERRRQGALEITGFFGSSELFAPHLNVKEIMQDAYRDIGVKNPERYMTFEDDNPEAEAIQEEAEAMIEELQAQLAQMQEELQKFTLLKERHDAEKAKLVNEKATMAAENKLLEEQLQLVIKRDQGEKQLLATRERIINELKSAEQKLGAMAMKNAQDGEQRANTQASAAQSTAANLVSLIEQERNQVADMLEFLNKEKEDRTTRTNRIREFIKTNGTPEAAEFVDGL